jgi:hypothetical protein
VDIGAAAFYAFAGAAWSRHLTLPKESSTMSETANVTFDPAKRRLCPDGSCVGVVAADGRCKVCGVLDEGAAGLGPEAFAGGCATDEDDDLGFDRRAVLAAELDTGDFDPTRKLCADGSCVGVLGSDGRCKVCGRSAEA